MLEKRLGDGRALHGECTRRPPPVVIASDRLGRRSAAAEAGKRGNLVAWHAVQTEIASLTLAMTTDVRTFLPRKVSPQHCDIDNVSRWPVRLGTSGQCWNELKQMGQSKRMEG